MMIYVLRDGFERNVDFGYGYDVYMKYIMDYVML